MMFRFQALTMFSACSPDPHRFAQRLDDPHHALGVAPAGPWAACQCDGEVTGWRL